MVIIISFSIFNTKGILNFKRDASPYLIDYFLFTMVTLCFGKLIIGKTMLTPYVIKFLQNTFMGDQSKK